MGIPDGPLLRVVYLTLLMVLIVRADVAVAASILFVLEDSPGFQALVPALKRSFRNPSNVIKVAQSADNVVIMWAVTEDFAPGRGKNPGAEADTLRQWVESADHNLKDLCKRADVVVVAGPTIAQRSLLDCPTPKLLLFTPRYLADELVATDRSGPVSAIYLEADPLLNLRLIKRALPQAATVAVLVSPTTEAWLPRLQAEADRLGLALQAIKANNDEEVVSRLRGQINAIDALLLIPDDHIINGWSLKPILLMTARHFVPVIGGLASSYVKAGVTAAVVQSLERAGPQIKRVVQQLAQGQVTQPSYPEATQIVVNEFVARTLSIKTDHLAGADAQ